MLKKLVVGAIAAGVLAVPLAGVAGADPSLDNPGVPGNFGEAVGAPTGFPPGQRVKQVARLPKTLDPGGRPRGFSVNDTPNRNCRQRRGCLSPTSATPSTTSRRQISPGSLLQPHPRRGCALTQKFGDPSG